MASTPFTLSAGEEELIDGFANKTTFFGGGGGKLVLTNQRLIWANRRKTKVYFSIPMNEIIHVARVSGVNLWTWGLIVTFFWKNAVRITLKGGRSYRFVVNNQDRWVDLIEDGRRKTAVPA